MDEQSEKHLSEVLDAREQGELLVFCGAGISRSVLPDFKGLVNDIKNHISINPEGESDINAFIEEKKYPEAISAIEMLQEGNREKILRFIHNDFNSKQKDIGSGHPVLEIHKIIINLATNNNVTRIFNFNYDRFFSEVSHDLRFLTYSDEIRPHSEWKNTSLIFHCHGRVGHEAVQELIISYEDYQKLYSNSGEYFLFLKNLIKKNTIIFLGYSVEDIIKYITRYGFESPNELKIYAVFPQGDEANNVKREARNKVSPIKPIEYELLDKHKKTNFSENLTESFLNFLRKLDVKISSPTAKYDTDMLKETRFAE